MDYSSILTGTNSDKRFYGIYRGICVDSIDPISKGRVRLQVPQILGTAVTDWAWPIVSGSGTLTAPAINSGIWVMFEGGDPNFPLWVGTFNAQASTPVVVSSDPRFEPSLLLMGG